MTYLDEPGDAARWLGSLLAPSPQKQLVRRLGTVTAVTGGTPPTVTATVSGTDIPGIRLLASASVAIGDVVWIDFNGSDPLCLGKMNNAIFGGAAFSPGIELYNPSSTPFVDFHRAANPAGDSSADYNMRIINDASGILSVLGGKLQVDAAARMGQSGYGSNYAAFGYGAIGIATTTYAFMQEAGGEIYVNSNVRGSLRNGNNEKLAWASTGVLIPQTPLYFKTMGDNAHRLQYYAPGDFMEYFTWQEHKFWCQNALWGSIGPNAAGILCNSGWLRLTDGAVGWFNNTEGCGMRAGNLFGSSDSIDPQHNETQVVGRKLSQGGWATAGIESFSEASNGVPYITNHANGCCTNSWRKNSGASDATNVNSGGGCDWVYAANHPICSEEARKHNVSVIDDYGLKTLRGLEAKRYQYKPTDEWEIWTWESWKSETAAGKWPHAPSEHMGWETWHIGYFAEEMINLVPEVVGLHPDGTPRGIDYGNLIVVVIEAVKELADRVEDLEALIAKERRYAPAA